MTEHNPNNLFADRNSAAQTAKAGFDLLAKNGVIQSYSWEKNERGHVSRFLVWPISDDHAPLVLSPLEAVAFCRGARTQYIALTNE